MLARPLVDPPTDLTPEQKLAAAVLRQALLDVTSHPGKGARALIAGWLLSTTNRECRLWCHIAGIDHADFVARVRRAIGRT